MMKRNKYVDESVDSNTERYRDSKNIAVEVAYIKTTGMRETISFWYPAHKKARNDIISIIKAIFLPPFFSV